MKEKLFSIILLLSRFIQFYLEYKILTKVIIPLNVLTSSVAVLGQMMEIDILVMTRKFCWLTLKLLAWHDLKKARQGSDDIQYE